MGLSGGAYEWQKQRRREGVAMQGKIPVSGFGVDGTYTLWLLSPAIVRKVKFKNGKPVVETFGDCVTDPKLLVLRNAVVTSIKSTDDGVRGILTADLRVMEYGAALILNDYKMTDDELEMLMPSGIGANDKWITSLCTHAVGGQDSIDAMSRINPVALRGIIEQKTKDKSENQTESDKQTETNKPVEIKIDKADNE